MKFLNKNKQNRVEDKAAEIIDEPVRNIEAERQAELDKAIAEMYADFKPAFDQSKETAKDSSQFDSIAATHDLLAKIAEENSLPYVRKSTDGKIIIDGFSIEQEYMYSTKENIDIIEPMTAVLEKTSDEMFNITMYSRYSENPNKTPVNSNKEEITLRSWGIPRDEFQSTAFAYSVKRSVGDDNDIVYDPRIRIAVTKDSTLAFQNNDYEKSPLNELADSYNISTGKWINPVANAYREIEGMSKDKLFHALDSLALGVVDLRF